MTASALMPPPTSSLPIPSRDASTVILVRDRSSGSGIEVGMVRRNPGASFAGGAYVFPGGVVDESDRDAALFSFCRGRTDGEASQALGLQGGGGLAFWVAAIRECFEEAGVLLATDGRGEFVAFDEPRVVERFTTYRRSVERREMSMATLCATESLMLATDRLHYFAHWITPLDRPRRFDTRFFVAIAPPAQALAHDDGETVESLWVRPSELLDRCRAGALHLMPPTVSSLREVARHERVDQLLEAVAGFTIHPLQPPPGGGQLSNNAFGGQP